MGQVLFQAQVGECLYVPVDRRLVQVQILGYRRQVTVRVEHEHDRDLDVAVLVAPLLLQLPQHPSLTISLVYLYGASVVHFNDSVRKPLRDQCNKPH